MFVKTIIEEGISSSDKDDVVIECNKLIDAKHAVERLNGVEKTTVVLKKNDDNLMIISGGKENKYIVFAKLNGKSYFMTNKFVTKKEDVTILVAKKKQKHSSKRIFNLGVVLQAVKHFVQRGSLIQLFDWERT